MDARYHLFYRRHSPILGLEQTYTLVDLTREQADAEFANTINLQDHHQPATEVKLFRVDGSQLTLVGRGRGHRHTMVRR